jgi:hypothetical protein
VEEGRMIEHVYTVLCSRTAENSETGQFSLIDVVDEVDITALEQTTADPLTVLPLEASIITYWVNKSPGEGTNRERVRLVLRTASGQEFGSDGFDYEVDLSQSWRMRASATISAIPIDGVGIYRFSVRLLKDDNTWEEVGHFPLLVKKQDQR